LFFTADSRVLKGLISRRGEGFPEHTIPKRLAINQPGETESLCPANCEAKTFYFEKRFVPQGAFRLQGKLRKMIC